MIYLTKGQPLVDNPNLVVYDSTGYYNDGDSVICASAGLPEEPVCRYEAKYILYGGMVYSISNPEELMAEIIKIDPASLFGKDSQQLAVDKMVQEIVPQESGEVVEDATTEVVEPPAENLTTPETTPLTDPETITSTSSPSLIDDQTSTTTPDIILPEPDPLTDTASTSPITIPTEPDVSTTTSSVINDIVGTSTDQVTP